MRWAAGSALPAPPPPSCISKPLRTMSAGEHKQSQRRGHSRSHNMKSQSQRIKAKQEPPAPIPSIPSTAVSIAGNQSFPLPVPPAQDTRGRPPTCSGMKAATALTARRAPQQPLPEQHSTGLIAAASSRTAAHSQHLQGRSSQRSVVLPLQHPPACRAL